MKNTKFKRLSNDMMPVPGEPFRNDMMPVPSGLVGALDLHEPMGCVVIYIVNNRSL